MKKEKSPTSKYFERIYLAWVNIVGQVRPQSEFAVLVGMERQRFNNYYNGKRADLDYQSALKICQAVNSIGIENPYELLDLLGFPKPVDDPFADMPPEMSSPLRAALKVINSRIAAEGVPPDTEAAWAIVAEELAKIGLNPKQ